jgi:TolB-like protein/Flp pilus assembly protein TadD
MPKPPSVDRLDSWKEIAVFLQRGVRTVQRWEREEALPVHRHQHRKLGSVYAFHSEVSAWWASRRRDLESGQAPAQTKTKSRKLKLLVLPFENLSGDPAQDYLSDGLTEEMITRLARLQPDKLAVVARTTAVHYKGAQRRITDIAKELSLDYVLEGSVRRNAGQVRITAQLIKADDETHLWAETYDRNLSDVLALQGEAATQIAKSIHLALTPPQRARRRPTRPIAPEAYEHYLKGRYHLNKLTPQDAGVSIQWFERAVQKDPGFALAYAGIAHAYSLLAIAPFDALPPRQAMPKAAEAVKHALKLDAKLPEAHSALGVIRHHYDWDWKGAEKSFQRALDLNPAYSGARLRYAWLLLSLGRTSAALKEIQDAQKIAQEVDPHLLVVIRSTRAAAFYFAREYDKAIAECTDALELDSGYFLLHYLLGRCHARKGLHAAAIAALKTNYTVGHIPLVDTGLALAHAVNGGKDATTSAIAQLQTLAKFRYVPATYMGILYAGLNDHAKAFEWLERAYEERADGLTLLNVDPMVDGLRSDQRFGGLLARIGF